MTRASDGSGEPFPARAAANVPRGLIGVVHLRPMPGDPLYDGSAAGFDSVIQAAVADADALCDGGAAGVIVENFGSVPFAKGCAGSRLEPHQVALIALVAAQVRARHPAVKVGVNCLRNDALSAVSIAAAAGLHFVRVNVHVGAMVTDQGLIEGEAHRTLRLRQRLGAPGVAILADVLVKHAAPLGALTPEQATADALGRGLADAVVVSGEATGAAVSCELLERVRRAAGDALVLIGSGLTPERVIDRCPLADGAIVGTWLKHGGRVRAPVDPTRVRELAAAVQGQFR